MRHFIAALPITASACGMFEASFKTLLITPTRCPQRLTADCFGTVVRTINLTAIATRLESCSVGKGKTGL